MPTDVDPELVESFEQLNAALLAEYQREPRRIRRSVSRDLARAHPVAPKRAQHGAVARWVSPPKPRKRVLMGPDAQLAQTWRAPVSSRVASPRSGQARVNAKRNRRADFWFRFKIAADDRAEAQALASIYARAVDLRWPMPK